MTPTGHSSVGTSPATEAEVPAGSPSATTLGAHVGGQLRRLCDAVGAAAPEGDGGARALAGLLGPAAPRPLAAGPPSPSFVSDDHSPAELSVAFPGGGAPTVRVLADPGCAAATLADSARMGRRALDALAARWNFSTEPVRRVEDLFLPAAPHGSFALWCAMELRDDRPPGVKVYVNPLAHGRERSVRVAEEALARFGFGRAWPALRDGAAPRCPDGDELLFFALDLGCWQSPRVKIYVAHHGFSAHQAQTVSRLLPGGSPRRVGEFCRTVGDTELFDRRPLVSCLSFTEQDGERPSGYTLHVPVRDYAGDDRAARDRAATVLRRHGADTALLDRALAAMTRRRLTDGVGLISYVSLVQSSRRPPRVTVYFSPEAYRVRPPRELSRPNTDACRR